MTASQERLRDRTSITSQVQHREARSKKESREGVAGDMCQELCTPGVVLNRRMVVLLCSGKG